MAPPIRKKLTITSLTSGGRSVGIVRWRTQATDFSLVLSFRHKTFWRNFRGSRDDTCPLTRWWPAATPLTCFAIYWGNFKQNERGTGITEPTLHSIIRRLKFLRPLFHQSANLLTRGLTTLRGAQLCSRGGVSPPLISTRPANVLLVTAAACNISPRFMSYFTISTLVLIFNHIN
jgi:hypothetical protein